MAAPYTLTEFEQADCELRAAESQQRFFLHTASFIVVNIVLIALNLVVIPTYPWSMFLLVIWGLGLLAHYFVAFRWIQSENAQWAARVEYRAEKIAQAHEIVPKRAA
jgi:2TM domain